MASDVKYVSGYQYIRWYEDGEWKTIWPGETKEVPEGVDLWAHFRVENRGDAIAPGVVIYVHDVDANRGVCEKWIDRTLTPGATWEDWCSGFSMPDHRLVVKLRACVSEEGRIWIHDETQIMTLEYRAPPCETACEVGCETGCEVSCETSCERTCQTTCERGCETRCEVSCQTGCEVSCEDRCERACETACERACERGCEISCETGCEVACERGCEVTCETGCEVACETMCETNCEGSCEVGCETGCEVSCERRCETSCQDKCEQSLEIFEWLKKLFPPFK